jgi:hypothetical protein
MVVVERELLNNCLIKIFLIMKQFLITSFAILFISNVVIAQNNTIFFGGSDDGFTASSFSQIGAIQLYLGGGGDAWNIDGYSQNSTGNLYLGGASNSWMGANYIQATINDRFLGGVGNTWASNNYVQASINDRFLGGTGNTWANNSYEQASINDRFLGGIGDGWVAQAAILPLGPLSADFVSFIGHQETNYDILNWTTTNEKNTSHFIIEHSANATQFFELGMVNANGNTSTNID